jgi:hypothetical protein
MSIANSSRLPPLKELSLTDAGLDLLGTMHASLEHLSFGVARLAPYKSSA